MAWMAYFVVGCALCRTVPGYLWAPHLPTLAYYLPGDILIGALYSAREATDGDQSCPCSGDVVQWRLQQNIEAVRWAVQKVNERDDLLPDHRLGFVILDDCRTGTGTIGKATRFLPVAENFQPPPPPQGQPPKSRPASNEPLRQRDHCELLANETQCTTSSMEFYREKRRHNECSRAAIDGPRARASAENWPVSIVVGSTSTSRAALASALYNAYHLPMVTPEATGDELSSNVTHAYLARLVPPDGRQAEAIANLLATFNWTHVSILSTQQAYGTAMSRRLQRKLSELDMCVAFVHEFGDVADESDYAHVLDELTTYTRAKVVILLLDIAQVKSLMRAVREKALYGRFIWLGSDTLDARSYTSLEREAEGALALSFPLGHVAEFAELFGALNPEKTENPWFVELWQNVFGCNVSDGGCAQRIDSADSYFFSDWTSRTIDSVSAAALALDGVARAGGLHCVANRTCIADGRSLRDELLNVSFNGTSGRVHFDDNGDLIGQLHVTQLQRVGKDWNTVVLATTTPDGGLHFHRQPDWSFLQDGDNVTDVRILSGAESYFTYTSDVVPQNLSGAPESSCRPDCPVGAARVQSVPSCCSACSPCQPNQIVVNDACETCPSPTWPSPERNNCTELPINRLGWQSVAGSFIALFSTFGLLAVVAFAALLFGRFRHYRLIKASSPPLTACVFAGLATSFATPYFIVSTPSVWSCGVSQVGFHLGSAIVYSTLFVKTSRLYRIFRGARHFRKPSHLISLKSQLGLVLAINLLMLMCLLLSEGGDQDWFGGDQVRMPNPGQKYVEWTCVRPSVSLLAPLIFNMTLLVACVTFAFLTRHLPDAFNESWFILLSAITSLVIMIAFIPTYLFMEFAIYREVSLSLSLHLSGFATTGCLLVPKLYACVKQKAHDIQTGFQTDDSLGKVSVRKLNNRLLCQTCGAKRASALLSQNVCLSVEAAAAAPGGSIPMDHPAANGSPFVNGKRIRIVEHSPTDSIQSDDKNSVTDKLQKNSHV